MGAGANTLKGVVPCAYSRTGTHSGPRIRGRAPRTRALDIIDGTRAQGWRAACRHTELVAAEGIHLGPLLGAFKLVGSRMSVRMVPSLSIDVPVGTEITRPGRFRGSAAAITTVAEAPRCRASPREGWTAGCLAGCPCRDAPALSYASSDHLGGVEPRGCRPGEVARSPPFPEPVPVEFR